MAKKTIDFRLRALEAKTSNGQNLLSRFDYIYSTRSEADAMNFLKELSDEDLQLLKMEAERQIACDDG